MADTSVSEFLLIGRLRIGMLVVLPLIPLVMLLIYYLVWWIAAKFSESARLHQESMLLMVETKRYEELRNYMNETRALRHDFRQHILVLTQLADSGNLEELRDYLHQFSASAERNYTGYCDNIIIDAVASYYASFAERQRAVIKYSLNLPRALPMKEADYCVILGNLLENALNAMKDIPDGERYMNVISSLISDSIIGLSIENPYIGEIKFGKNGLPKSGHEDHGIGLMSVLNTVKRYGGSMKVTAEKNIFSVDIVLYCKSD